MCEGEFIPIGMFGVERIEGFALKVEDIVSRFFACACFADRAALFFGVLVEGFGHVGGGFGGDFIGLVEYASFEVVDFF